MLSENSKPFIAATNLLTAVTATGAGAAVNLGIPMSSFTCTVKWGGTAPTSTTVILQGSIDGTLWADLQTVVVSADEHMFHVASKPVMFVRGNYSALVGGDETTTVTMKMMAGGN